MVVHHAWLLYYYSSGTKRKCCRWRNLVHWPLTSVCTRHGWSKVLKLHRGPKNGCTVNPHWCAISTCEKIGKAMEFCKRRHDRSDLKIALWLYWTFNRPQTACITSLRHAEWRPAGIVLIPSLHLQKKSKASGWSVPKRLSVWLFLLPLVSIFVKWSQTWYMTTRGM